MTSNNNKKYTTFLPQKYQGWISIHVSNNMTAMVRVL